MRIDEKFLDSLEDISRLRLNDNERMAVSKGLSEILECAEMLGKLDTNREPELTHPFGFTNRFREDIVTNGNSRELLLQNAKNKDGCFIVPRTVD